jgi:DNA-binding NarL/FixJ family response regulator
VQVGHLGASSETGLQPVFIYLAVGGPQVCINVFIADDHPVVRDILKGMLEENPMISVIGDAANGPQAVSRVRSLNPDVVVMDVSIPELNGITAAQRMLEASPQVRVILLSMLGNPGQIYSALKAGARGFLLKKSACQELMEAVLAVHVGEVYLSSPVMNMLVTDHL